MRVAPVVIVTVIPEGSPAVRLELSDKITAFSYEDCETKADKLTLRVDNWDLENFDDPIWRKGNIVEVSWGYPGNMAPTRRCVIEKVTGFLELSIDALGLEVVLNREHRVRTFEGVSRSEVARRIARDWGYSDPSVVHIEDTRIAREVIAQGKQTDAEFLRRLAQKEGFQWWIDFDGFHFHKRNLHQQPLRTIEWLPTDRGGEVISMNVENDLAGKPGTVRVRGRDPLARRTLDMVASHETETSRPVLAKVQEAPGTDGKRVPGFIGTGQSHITTTAESSDAAAKAVAAAKFETAQQVAVKINVEMLGDPQLLAKSVIELRGAGKRLSQRYYLRTVKHVIGAGYTCRVEMISDGSGGHSTDSTLAEGASRVQVGPGVKGVRVAAKDTKKRGLDLPPEILKMLEGKDPDGAAVVKFLNQLHRELPTDAPDDDA